VFVCFVLVGLVLLVWFCVLGVRRSKAFPVNEIKVLGNKNVSENQIINKASIALGANIFTIGGTEIKQRIAGIDEIKKVRVWRDLPGTIVISVDEYEPFVRVYLGSKQCLCDRDGNLFHGKTDVKRVIICTSQGDVQPLVKIYSTIKDLNLPFVVGRIVKDKSGDVNLYAENFSIKGGALDADSSSEIRKKFNDLVKALNDVMARGEIPKYVDLRFYDQGRIIIQR
jgi:cell division septal protein FtsQ